MSESHNEPGLRHDPTIGERAFLAFQDLTPDGFMLFQPVRDNGGRIIDFEWSFVNAAAAGIVGRQQDDLVGKRLLVEMPGNKDEGLFDAYVSVIETGQVWQNEFHYDHGGITAWFRTTAARSGDGLAVSFADISEVRRGHERLRNLIDGVLAFIGVLSPDGVLLEANEPAVAATGLARDRLIGQPFWDCYWWNFDADTKDRLKQAIASAAQGKLVRYDAEIRVAGDQRLWIDFQISPVLDPSGRVIELIPSGVDITDRKHAAAHRELLIKELSHRVKNTLATIQSMASQTVRSATSMEEFRGSFSARLQSVAASHDLLVESDHQNASLEGLVRGQVLPYAGEESRLSLGGTDVLLPGDIAHPLGLILHELATNASKYGALSAEGGHLRVEWRVETIDDLPMLFLDWHERGGPMVAEPTRQGFGTRLIERSLAADRDEAVITYAPEGLSCNLKMALQ